LEKTNICIIILRHGYSIKGNLGLCDIIMSILIVDDDPNILTLIKAALESEGWNVFTATDGEKAINLTVNLHPELIILDLLLPRLSGVQVCNKLRQSENHTPILILSCIQDPNKKIELLNAGADDYITKPFIIEELIARVKSVVRRNEIDKLPYTTSYFKSGDLEIDIDKNRVKVRGEIIHLTPTEYKLLIELVLNMNRTLKYAHFLDKIWGSEYNYEKEYVHVIISRLRHKLLRHPEILEHIKHIRGVGYYFESD
jgi:DNA-binding response OmpR family regulator